MQTDTCAVAAGVETKANRRRRYVINPSFQWRYTLTIALAVFCLTSAVGSLLHLGLEDAVRERMIHPGEDVRSTSRLLIPVALGLASLSAAGVGLWSMLLTHRICGPLYVMKRFLDQLAAGQLPATRPLRRGDEFQDLYASLLQATEAVAGKQFRTTRHVSSAIDLLREVQGRSAGADKLTLQAIVEQLQKTQKTLEWSPAATRDIQGRSPLEPLGATVSS